MPDLNGTLDTVLGFVTIVLVLSLIIQSMQNIIKRLLRMRSRQAEQSLRLLFDYALTLDKTKYTQMKYASPIVAAVGKAIARVFGRSDDASVGDTLVEAVKGEVLEMGRKSYWGTALLDSVNKDDVTKILSAVSATKLGIDVEATTKKAIEEGKNAEQEVKNAIDEKVKQVEIWYDTVMPGLAERYERGMKWMAVVLSILVVVVFNANAITIFKYVASDSAVQKQLIEYGEQLNADRKKTAEQNPPAPPPANETADEKAARLKAETQKDVAETKSDVEKIKTMGSSLQTFGLTPAKSPVDVWNNIKNWQANLLGWLAMTLLLSMGAPFWEDALESLFGLKNTLRGKGKEQQKSQQ